MSKFTKGSDLELRAHRLAWHLGYFPRRRIYLYSDEGNPITDIDVIGLRFDSTLSPDFLLIETKSEKGFASILKLKGLLSYFNSNSAYIVRPNITPDIIRFSESLNISALHTSRLDEIEKEFNIKDDKWLYSFSLENDYKIAHFTELLKDDKYGDELELLNLFWEVKDPFYIIKMLIDANKYIYEKLNNGFKEMENALRYLNMELFTLFIIGIMRCCGELYKYPTHQRYKLFQERLVSGKLSFKEKEKLLDNFYSFLKNYSKSSGIKMELKRRDLSLVPPYGEMLYKLMNLYIEKSKFINKTPLIMDIIIDDIMNNRHVDKKNVIKELSLSEISYDESIILVKESAKFLYGSVPEYVPLK